MTVIREKEITATKKTWLIFETKLQGLQSSHVSKIRQDVFFIFKVFLVATFNAFPFLLLSLWSSLFIIIIIIIITIYVPFCYIL